MNHTNVPAMGRMLLASALAGLVSANSLAQEAAPPSGQADPAAAPGQTQSPLRFLGNVLKKIESVLPEAQPGTGQGRPDPSRIGGTPGMPMPTTSDPAQSGAASTTPAAQAAPSAPMNPANMHTVLRPVPIANASTAARYSLNKVYWLESRRDPATFQPTPVEESRASYLVYLKVNGQDTAANDSPPYQRAAISFVKRMDADMQKLYEQAVQSRWSTRLAASLGASAIQKYNDSLPLRERPVLNPVLLTSARNGNEDGQAPSFEDMDAIYRAAFRTGYDRACYDLDKYKARQTAAAMGRQQVSFPSQDVSINIEQLKNYRKVIFLPTVVALSKVTVMEQLSGGRQRVQYSWSVRAADPVIERAILAQLGGHFKDGIYRMNPAASQEFRQQFEKFIDKSKSEVRFSLTKGIEDKRFDPILRLRQEIAAGQRPELNGAALLMVAVWLYDKDSMEARALERAGWTGNFFQATGSLYGLEELPPAFDPLQMADPGAIFALQMADGLPGKTGDLSSITPDVSAHIAQTVGRSFHQAYQCAIFSNDVPTSSARGFRIDRMDDRLLKELK